VDTGVDARHWVLTMVTSAVLGFLRFLHLDDFCHQPGDVDVILERGGYNGRLLQELLEDPGVRFIAMARATKKSLRQRQMVAEERLRHHQPRRWRNPNVKIAETQTCPIGRRYPLRTVLIRDHTPETRQRWRPLFTKVAAEEMGPPEVDGTYRRREKHENSFAEPDHHVAGKCLPKPYGLLRVPNEQGQKRKTVSKTLSDETGLRRVAWLRDWAFNLVKESGAALGGPYATMRVGTLMRKFIARPGWLRLQGNELWVTMMLFAECHALTEWIRQLNQRRLWIPWLNHMVLQAEIAPAFVGLASNPRAVRQRAFANSAPFMIT
jgi:hypothetical protein